MPAGRSSGASPTDAQIIEAVIALRQEHGDVPGHAKLRAMLKKDNEWEVSEARLKKLFRELNLGSAPPTDAQVIEAVDAIRDQHGQTLGHAKLRTRLREGKGWAVSEARLKKLVPAVNQLDTSIVTPSDGQVLVALDDIHKEDGGDLATGKLRSLLKDRNKWAISEARLKKLVQRHQGEQHVDSVMPKAN